MSQKVCIYDTYDVLDAEFDAFTKKCGGKADEETMDKAFDEMLLELEKWFTSANPDGEEIMSRFEHTIEDETGEIWIMFKMFKVQDLRKKLGTEP